MTTKDMRLREIRKVSSNKPQRKYRWFNSPGADLYVWSEGQHIQAFEYSYDKPNNEHILRWNANQGFKHMRVDDGEDSPFMHQSPLIAEEADMDLGYVARHFRNAGIYIDSQIYYFVLDKLFINF